VMLLIVVILLGVTLGFTVLHGCTLSETNRRLRELTATVERLQGSLNGTAVICEGMAEVLEAVKKDVAAVRRGARA